MTEWSVYVLKSTVSNYTYVGYTRTLKIIKRLAKHNGLLVGGAKATTRHRPWQVAVSVDGLERRAAMQLEWRMHRRHSGPSGYPGRMQQLAAALRMEKWTSTAPLRSQLTNLTVCWHLSSEDGEKPVCLEEWIGK